MLSVLRAVFLSMHLSKQLYQNKVSFMFVSHVKYMLNIKMLGKGRPLIIKFLTLKGRLYI